MWLPSLAYRLFHICVQQASSRPAAEAHEISASKGEMMSSQLKPLCTKRNRSDVAVLPIRALLPRSAVGDWGYRQALEAGEELQGSNLAKPTEIPGPPPNIASPRSPVAEWHLPANITFCCQEDGKVQDGVTSLGGRFWAWQHLKQRGQLEERAIRPLLFPSAAPARLQNPAPASRQPM
jgi:hypothetical protein